MKTSKPAVFPSFSKTRLATLLLASLCLFSSSLHAEEIPKIENSELSGELLYEILLGEMTLREGNWNDAFALMLDAARKSNDYQLYAHAVDIALQARSGDAALIGCKAWIDAYPQDRRAHEQMLQILTAVNKTPDTLAPLQQYLALTPSVAINDVISLIPRYYAHVQDKAQAIEVVEKALDPYLQKSETAANAYTTLGRMKLLNGDLDGALQAAQKGHTADPASIQPALLALELLGKQVADATPIIEQTLTRQQSPELALNYSRVLIELNRYNQATEVLSVVTQKNADNADAWLILGSLQYELNQDQAADASLLHYLSLIKPDTTEVTQQKGITQAQIRRATIAARQGHFDKAMQIVDQLPASSPDDTRNILATKVQLLREQKQWQRAYDLLDQAKSDDLDLIYEQAMLAERLDRMDNMERLLRRVIEQDPKYYNAYNALGFSLADRGLRLSEAKSLIVKAVNLAPDDPYITDSLGWVEFRMGHLTSALSSLEKAYSDKKDPEIGAHLGEVLWALERRDEAVKVWKESLQAEPQNETLKSTLQRLNPPL